MPTTTGTERRSATVRLWLLLSVAFVIAAAGGGFVMLQATINRSLAMARQDTARSARIIAWATSGRNPVEARDRAESFRGAIMGLRGVQYLTKDRYQATWDYGMAQQALQSGNEVVSDTYVSTDGTPSLYAYVPVPTDTGASAVVAVQMDATGARDSVASAYGIGLVGLLIACMIGAVFSLSLTRHFLRNSSERRLWKLLHSRRYLRTATLEFLLCGVAGTILIAGCVGIYGVSQRFGERNRIEARRDALEHFETLARTATDHEVALLKAEAEPLGLIVSNRYELIRTLGRAKGELRIEDDRITQELEGHWRAIALVMFFSALLTVLSLGVARATSERENDLDHARSEAARSELANKQIVDSLPIGFYTYSTGHIGYCNQAWRSLVHQTEGEDAYDALVASLHPDEKEAVLGALADAVETGSGFGFGHRLVSANGDVRHVESRGVPIFDGDGRIEHVVGFTLDVTTRVKTRQLLEAKTNEVEATNSRLRQALSDQEDNFEAMVLALVKAVEAKDPYTAGHSERVMDYAVRIGEQLGLSPYELRVLRMGSLIHDIGKIGIPDYILTKPDALTPEEFEQIKLHPQIGAGMVEGIPMFKDCLPIVLQHHERLDGSGYPFGLRASEISLLVRIVSVADAFDAMTSDRAYRVGWDVSSAVRGLREEGTSGALDPYMVDCLTRVIEQYGVPSGANQAA